MAEEHDDQQQDKQHQPTEKHLSELKKKGQFLRSKDLTAGSILITGILTVLLMSPFYQKIIQNNFVRCFQAIPNVLLEEPYELYRLLAIDNLLMIMPLGIFLIILAYLTSFLFGGWGFSLSLVHFKAERLSWVKNLKRILSLQNAFELFKSIVKISIFFGTLSLFIYINQIQILQLMTKPLHQSWNLVLTFLCWVIGGVCLIILIDLLYNYFSHQKKIMMTHKQVKDEQKESDVNPEVKRKIRQIQQTLSKYQVQQSVKSANVVVTNPTHYSVALRYEEGKDKAPRILLKGVEHKAKEIRMAAILHGIPIYEAPTLARAIYFTGKPGQFIHPDLYMAMAIVLSYIQQLKFYQAGIGQKPEKQDDLQIPKELIF